MPGTSLLGMLAALGLVVILAPGVRGDLADPRFFREDTRGVVAWLKQNADPGRDLILVDQRYPFGFYYERWNNDPYGFPPQVPAELAPAQYLFVDINRVAGRLAGLAHGRERVFWVRWFESDTDPRGAVPFLLEKFGTPVGERAFRGYTVSAYAIDPAAQFELAPALGGPPADFGNQMRLVEHVIGGRGPGPTSTLAETRATSAPADKPVWAVARWAALPAASEPGKAQPHGLKATVVLEDADGLVVGRDDRPILNDRHLAPDQWSASDRPLGVYLVQPSPATPPGTYTLRLAVYDPATLTPLPAGGEAAAGSFATLGQVALTQATAPPSPEQLPISAPASLSWQGVRLLGRGDLPATIGPGDRLAFDAFWQAEQAKLSELRARLLLTRADGQVSAEVPLAHEGPPVPGYPTTAWTFGELLRGRQRWQLDPRLPAGDYRVGLQLLGPAGDTSPTVDLGSIAVAGRPHVYEPPGRMAVTSGARFGDFATLLGFDAEPVPDISAGGGAVLSVPAGQSLAVTLYWRAEAASAVPYKVSLQLLDVSGVLRVQRDQQPGEGAFPTSGWVAGEVLADVCRLDLPADLAPGRYRLIARMYDPVLLAVLPATAPDGRSFGDTLPLADVQVR